jgi:antitoxin MazE
MKCKVQKWGNSLALRIPKSFAEEVGLKKESPVDISVENGKLVIAPVTEPPVTLEQLLDMITEDNLHREVETGPPTGDEAWQTLRALSFCRKVSRLPALSCPTT